MPANKIRDYSGTITSTGVPQTLFPEYAYSGLQERFVTNINSNTSLWVNFNGGPAVIGQPGSIEVYPNSSLSAPITGSWSIVGLAGAPFTAGER